MNGILYITGALADGGVTTAKIANSAVLTTKIADANVTTAKIQDSAVSTAKIADSAVATAKIADSAVLTSKIAAQNITTPTIQDSAVTTAKIADEAVTLAKLPHGTSSNDGKFLRANNGADPTFETVSGTTINNNADNKIITGSGTANTLEAESLAQIGSDGDLWIGHAPTTHYDNRKAFFHQPTADESCYVSITGPQGAGIVFGDSVGQNTGNYESIIWHRNSDDRLMITTDNGNKGLYIENGGDVEVIDGNIKFASGHGIDFSASSNESGSTTELLDDYERGSFNAYWKFDPTNATGVTYTYNGGMYVKIGRMVYFTIHMWTSNKGSLASGSGWCQIEGLPFAVDGEGGFASISYYDNFGSYNPAVARVTPNEQIYIAQHNSGGYSQDLQHSHMNNNSRMHIGGCYATTS
jgi:hypothetical protein